MRNLNWKMNKVVALFLVLCFLRKSNVSVSLSRRFHYKWSIGCAAKLVSPKIYTYWRMDILVIFK